MVSSLGEATHLRVREVALRDNIIMVKNPFINNIEALLGFMEGLLGCPLVAKTTISPIVIETQAAKEAEAGISDSQRAERAGL